MGFHAFSCNPSLRVGPLISLFAMAIACGNIKPCLAAFGGDQFKKDQVSLLSLSIKKKQVIAIVTQPWKLVTLFVYPFFVCLVFGKR